MNPGELGSTSADFLLCINVDKVLKSTGFSISTRIVDFSTAAAALSRPARLLSGNVAWMHILAARALRERPDALGGEAFYCYDDSPYKSYEEFNMQFLSTFNFRRVHIPLFVLWLLAFINDLLRWLLSPVYAFTPLLNRYTYATVSTSFTVSTDKAWRHFQYRPLYGWGQCKTRTLEWVSSFAGDKAKGL